MSYLVSQTDSMKKRFGIPDFISYIQPTRQDEIEFIRSTMCNGRAHDLTLFIRESMKFLFIAKPFYPGGLFRAPSGGVNLYEDFIDGAKREALEETGVVIELDRFILQINVTFRSETDALGWTSYIFTAKYIAGIVNPIDMHEISEARWVTLNEIPKFRELMLSSGRAGLEYRAFLTDESLSRII